MAIDRKTYNAYISSNAWRVRRDVYFQKHLRKCLACGSTDEIHLHHRSYDNFTKEKDGDLRALCAKCHKRLHRLQKKHGWTLESTTDYVINRGLKIFAPRKKRKLRAKKKVNQFVHLHNHSDRSLLDGMTVPEEMAFLAHSHGSPAVSVTDHGTMSAILALQKACQKYNIKNISGLEAYYVPNVETDDDDKTRERFHLIVLAKNQLGLEKMFKVQQRAWTENFYYKNRMEFSDLEYLAGDVVVLSGCMGGQLARLLAAQKFDEAEQLVSQFKTLLGEDYYIEIQPWNEGDLNPQLFGLANDFDIPIVGTLDCHYPLEKDAGTEEFLLMMGQMPGLKAAHKKYAQEMAEQAKGVTNLIKKMDMMYPDRFLKFGDIQPYMMSPDEVFNAFEFAGDLRGQIMENTLVIADKCNSQIQTKQSLLPKFSHKYDSEFYLRELAETGLQDRGHGDDPVYIDRLNHELDVICELGFADYFLIVWDICNFADRNSIPRGPGRGSVVGSLLAYALKITKPDPIRFNLLFERFLNKDRVSVPDIDMDFGDKYRDQMKQYTKDRWGDENVASVATYEKFKAKGTIKKALSVLQVPFDQANALSPLFETFDDFKNNKTTQKTAQEYPQLLPIAERLEGRISGNGAHASAVVISKEPLWKHFPMESRGMVGEDDRLKVVAFDGNETEEVGAWKFDFLGLKAVSVIDDCIKKIKELYGTDVTDISEALDDIYVIKQFNEDSLSGIFQAEGSGYKNLIEEMGIDELNDLIASTALVRPGAYNTQGRPYIDRKHGREYIDYPHECLESVLKETYGTVVYQEQLMLLSMELCGFSMTEADTLRKIIGKKRDAKEFLPFYEKFMSGAMEKVDQSTAQELWENLEKTAEYMFNKSHSVGYTYLAYQTMWLKFHYPTEFIWSCLTNETNPKAVASFLIDGKRLGVGVLPPDINLSDASFTLEHGAVRFGLGDINKAGPSAVEEILAHRPYHSYEEFVGKVKKSAVKAPLLLNLEKIGAFGSVGYDAGYDVQKYYLEVLNCTMYVDEDARFDGVLTQLDNVSENSGLSVVRGIVKAVKRTPTYFRVELEDDSGTRSFFADDKQAAIRKGDFIVALVGEKNLAGFASPEQDSPFLDFILNPQREPYLGVCDTLRGSNVCGVVISCKTFKTKKTGQTMGNPLIYDIRTGEYKKWTIFPSDYEKYKSLFQPFSYVVLQPNDQPGIIKSLISIEKYAKMKDLEPLEWFEHQLTTGV